MGVISGVDPRHGRRPVRQPADARDDRRRRAPRRGRLADDPRDRRGRLPAARQRRDRRDEVPDRDPRQRIVPDSEGAGRFRGAPGAYVEYGPVDCSTGGRLPERRDLQPRAGRPRRAPGGNAAQQKRARDGTLSDELGATRAPSANRRDHRRPHCGGGGYGPPHERDTSRVVHDANEGWITRERAFEVYGVKLDPDGEVDTAATIARRSELETATRTNPTVTPGSN